MIMGILQLALIGFIIYLIVTEIPMPQPFKAVITVIGAVYIILKGAALLGVPLT
jgi:hypothetical protein